MAKAPSVSFSSAAQATQCLISYASATELQALEHTTYGVEVERYNLKIPDDQRAAFADEYKQAIIADLRQEAKQALGVDDIPAGSRPQAELCCIKKNGQVIMTVRLDGEKEFAVQPTEYLTAPKHQELFNIEFISEGVGAGIKGHKEFMEDCSKSERSDIRLAVEGFKVAVDRLSSPTDASATHTTSEPSTSSSAITVGEFEFVFPDLGARILRKPGALEDQRYKPSKEGPEASDKKVAFHVTHSLLLPKEMTSEYRAAFALTLAVEKDTTQASIIKQHCRTNPEVALKTALGIKDDTQDFTGSRNNNQPLFKCPREYLLPSEPADPHTPSGYLQAALRGEVLQPTSNRLDYLELDLAMYREVHAELIAKQQQSLQGATRSSVEVTTTPQEAQQEGAVHQASNASEQRHSAEVIAFMRQRMNMHQGLNLRDAIRMLELSIKCLNVITQAVRGQGRDETAAVRTTSSDKPRDSIRVFESHDEKLKPLMQASIDRDSDTRGTIGLIELRSGAALQDLARVAVFDDLLQDSTIDTSKQTRVSREYLTNLSHTVSLASNSYVEAERRQERQTSRDRAAALQGTLMRSSATTSAYTTKAST